MIEERGPGRRARVEEVNTDRDLELIEQSTQLLSVVYRLGILRPEVERKDTKLGKLFLYLNETRSEIFLGSSG